MKFVIQKIDNEIRHDFAFTLLEAVRFHNWLEHGHNIHVKYVNTKEDDTTFMFKPMHKTYVPIGSVEFVSAHLYQFYGLTPKPINVPESLYPLAQREIFIGTNRDLDGLQRKWFVKSMDKIKGLVKVIDNPTLLSVPPGGVEKYQISEYINIDSEWRAFVYKGKLVGLQNYVGEFTEFPDIQVIRKMIKMYKDAPIAYTLDVGINYRSTWEMVLNEYNTFVIEVHDFFSCGLYGFADLAILPNMFYRAYQSIIKNKK